MGVHRRLVLVLLLASAAALAALGACSSSETAPTPAVADDAAGDVADVILLEPADAAPPACKLVTGTGVKACDDCLQASCCVVINACFDDKACEALNACIADCGASLGRTDAGAQCVRDCVNARPDAGPMVLDLMDCESTRCGSDCK